MVCVYFYPPLPHILYYRFFTPLALIFVYSILTLLYFTSDICVCERNDVTYTRIYNQFFQYKTKWVTVVGNA